MSAAALIRPGDLPRPPAPAPDALSSVLAALDVDGPAWPASWPDGLARVMAEAEGLPRNHYGMPRYPNSEGDQVGGMGQRDGDEPLFTPLHVARLSYCDGWGISISLGSAGVRLWVGTSGNSAAEALVGETAARVWNNRTRILGES